MSSTIFILYLIIGGSSVNNPKAISISTQEFYTEAKCVEAKDRIKAKISEYTLIHIDCHRK